MGRKSRVDGLSLSIVILNVLIVGVIITLCVLIYLYMSGQLEKTDVSNMGQGTQSQAVITTTPITTGSAGESDDATSTTTTPPTSDESEGSLTTDEIVAVVDTYDPAFFANDLFIGDSIFTGLENYGFFPSSNVYAEIGLNPETAHTKEYGGYTSVTKAKELNPKRIFIMLGTNGLSYMGNTYMADQMKILVSELKEACPDSYIYVVSIPPVTKAHEAEGNETMSMVKGYNTLLKKMAEDTGVVYLDLCSQLQDNTGYFSSKYAEADGLHFLDTAYKKMLSFFQKTIGG